MSDFTQVVRSWVDLDLAGGQPYPGNPLLGPVDLVLQPGEQRAVRQRVDVPGNAPPGSYETVGRTGESDANVWEESRLAVQVQP